MADGVWERARSIRQIDDGRPLYERLANVLGDGIRGGDLPAGHRMPTVRELAELLQVSVTTVMSTYTHLRTEGLVTGEVGRGTFVTKLAGPAPSLRQVRDDDRDELRRRRPPRPAALPALAWRRGALALAESRLRAAFPGAADLMRGGPDPSMLPTSPIRRAWHAAAESLSAADLQYPTHLDPDPVLVEQLLPRLRRDDIEAGPDDILVASSTQQVLALVTELLRAEGGREQVIAAVEEPGYQTAMDTFERGGLALVGMAMDAEGVRPEALEEAIAAGARVALFTPRAQSPTGVSWTVQRRAALAEVLLAHPSVWIVEDDHFAEAASSRPGSLVSDPRLRERVIYVRSFSKSIAPDLRMSAVVAGDELRTRLALAKTYADGWTPRAAQRCLAALLADPETDRVLDGARRAYEHRRGTLADMIRERTDGAISATAGPDGLHLWLPMPSRWGAGEVVAETAGHGFLLATSDPFYLRPGHDRFIRLNAGVADLTVTSAVAEALARTARKVPSGRVVLTP
ncbi:PLP-dependent aminotransferase family protein [Plantactinospora sp. GCM10030261]|uniref:aminotransferase-like domain-containing protein n=1 Tax=Plantactinospora sp. GCM10030261 TaxID=3273420 RepID=UPI0036077051